MENNAAAWGLADGLGAAPYPLSEFHDDRWFSVFHFKTPAHAEAFQRGSVANCCLSSCRTGGDRGRPGELRLIDILGTYGVAGGV